MTKKGIRIDIDETKPNRNRSNSTTNEVSPTRKTLIGSARKAMSNLWTSLASPSKNN